MKPMMVVTTIATNEMITRDRNSYRCSTNDIVPSGLTFTFALLRVEGIRTGYPEPVRRTFDVIHRRRGAWIGRFGREFARRLRHCLFAVVLHLGHLALEDAQRLPESACRLGQLLEPKRTMTTIATIAQCHHDIAPMTPNLPGSYPAMLPEHRLRVSARAAAARSAIAAVTASAVAGGGGPATGDSIRTRRTSPPNPSRKRSAS